MRRGWQYKLAGCLACCLAIITATAQTTRSGGTVPEALESRAGGSPSVADNWRALAKSPAMRAMIGAKEIARLDAMEAPKRPILMNRLVEEWSQKQLRQKTAGLMEELREAPAEERAALMHQWRDNNRDWLRTHHQQLSQARAALRQQFPSPGPEKAQRSAEHEALVENLRAMSAQERVRALQALGEKPQETPAGTDRRGPQ